MCDHVKMYDYVAAALISVDIPKESDNHYICSTFVAELIDAYSDIDLDKNVHLYKPMDILALMESAVDRNQADTLNVDLPVQDEFHPGGSELLDAWTESVKQLADRAEDKILDKLELK